MKSWKINSLQFSIFIWYFITSSLIGIGVNLITSIAEKDAYISIIISYIIGFIPILLFIYLFNKNISITELTIKLFGKTIGTIINIITSLLLLLIASTLMYSTSNFIVSQFLSDTSITIIYISLGIVLLYGSSKGIETISRVALILIIFIIAGFILNIIGLTSQVKLDNFLPILEHGIKKDIIASLIFSLTGIIPIFAILSISKENIKDQKNTTKAIIITYTLSFLVAFILIILTIGTLGIYLTKIYQYPEYIILKKISFFNFLDRVENFISILWIPLSFIPISVIIYYIKNSIKKDNNSNILSLIIIAIIITLDMLIFKNNTIFTTFAKNTYPYINLILFIIIIIIIITSFIKRKKPKQF